MPLSAFESYFLKVNVLTFNKLQVTALLNLKTEV